MREGELDFAAAIERVPPRPWLIDGLDRWAARLEAGPAYRKAVVFVDNMGADLILGVLPLVAELLRQGTSVCDWLQRCV
jgi:type II pantothenate kinase